MSLNGMVAFLYKKHWFDRLVWPSVYAWMIVGTHVVCGMSQLEKLLPQRTWENFIHVWNNNFGKAMKLTYVVNRKLGNYHGSVWMGWMQEMCILGEFVYYYQNNVKFEGLWGPSIKYKPIMFQAFSGIGRGWSGPGCFLCLDFACWQMVKWNT